MSVRAVPAVLVISPSTCTCAQVKSAVGVQRAVKLWALWPLPGALCFRSLALPGQISDLAGPAPSRA